ncbi:MAG: aldo/keto reductase [Pseudomonadota bacterium]
MQFIEANGARIPGLGLGTMTLKETLCVEIVSSALKSGYRHVDTAANYGNEREVGEGLRAGGVKREDYFLTTKVWYTRIAAGDLERSAEESLEKFGVSCFDLFLIHWPNATIPLADSIGALNNVKRSGITKHIGVANFTIPMLEEAMHLTKEPLVTNQIEVHPFLDQTRLIAACRRHGLAISAYCPLARGKIADNETLARIGTAHGKSASQVSLRWLVQQDIIPIPRTSRQERLKENLAIFDFTLSKDEMAEIGRLTRPDSRVVNPAHAPLWDR